MSRSAFVRTLKRFVRPVRNPWLPRLTPAHLRALRLAEVDVARSLMPNTGRLLEIGAGAGWQAAALARMGFDVRAIDVAPSAPDRPSEWPVTLYDGVHIPFEDGAFDVIFSSNTLEHVADSARFQKELRRVLKDNGRAVHIVPSAVWRIWTNLTHPLAYFLPPLAHGEHAANAWTEVARFRRAAWSSEFQRVGWCVVDFVPTGLFYTGCSVADNHLSIAARRTLGRFVGSACTVFALEKDHRRAAEA